MKSEAWKIHLTWLNGSRQCNSRYTQLKLTNQPKVSPMNKTYYYACALYVIWFVISLAATLWLFYIYAHSKMYWYIYIEWDSEQNFLCPHHHHSWPQLQMVSQHSSSFPPLPNRKSKAGLSKCHPESDVNNSQAKKKSSKDFTSYADGNEVADHIDGATHCPKRPGVGSGGWVLKLENIRMALKKQMAQPQQVIGVAEDLPDNPLAPSKKQKQRKAKGSLWQACVWAVLIFPTVKWSSTTVPLCSTTRPSSPG